MEVVAAIAKNINKKRQDISVDKLSKMADIPASTIWKIIRQEVSDVKVTTLIALSKALKCKVDDLIRD